MIREQVREEARAWLGVPFRHQGRSRSGIDCAGLLIRIARKLGTIPPNFDVNGYRRIPDGTMLLVCDDVFFPATSLEEADVAVMKFRTDPQHIGVVLPSPLGGYALIHSLQSSGGVVQHRIDAVWKSRIVKLYKWPEVPRWLP